jgi:CBS domain-containing protein
VPHSARDLIHSEPLTVAADTPLLEVQHLLVLAQVSGMPVVEVDGRVLGVVGTSDLLRVLDQAFDEGNAQNVEQLFQTVRSLTARDLATLETLWVAPDTPAARVAALMRSERITRVLVGVNGQLEGVLTPFDLLVAITP